MSSLDDINPPSPNGQGDPGWQRLFADASEAPPPRVWDAIEQELDRDSENRVIIVPFWGRSMNWAWGAAAAVALLILGWWSLRTPAPADRSDSVATHIIKPGLNSDKNQPATTRTNTSDLASVHAEKSVVPSVALRQKSADAASTRPELASAVNRKKHPSNVSSDALIADPIPAGQSTEIATNRQVNSGRQRISNSSPIQSSDNRLAGRSVEKVPSISETGNPAISPAGSVPPTALVSQETMARSADHTVTELASLSTQPFRESMMYGTQRIVWFRPDATLSAPTEISSERRKDEKWASVSVMPSSFNPAVGLKPATNVYGNAFAQNSTPSQPSLKSQAETSVAYQLSAGRQLSSHWSVEAGLGYLEARSTVTSPIQTLVVSMSPDGRLSNLYADVLSNSRAPDNSGRVTAPSTPSKGTSSADALINSNVYDLQRINTLSNNYTFVQIPVQMGYQIRPRKRFGMAVLGGFLTNLFVRNTVNNQLSVTNSDGVYRPVTLSASTGLRFRYRPTNRWSASMAGMFQQALQRGTRQSADLSIRPQTMGVSVGLDYHF